MSQDEIAARMRRAITISTIRGDFADSGRKLHPTIAFSISYDSSDAYRAQKLVNELVAQFLSENTKTAQRSIAGTATFLAQESERLSDMIQGIEAKLAEFKRRNMGRLPESTAASLQIAERTDAELQRVEREIGLLQDRKLTLEAQFALTKPMGSTALSAGGGVVTDPVSSSEERLRALQVRYASASAIYGPDHPDVRRMQREIAVLRAGTGAAGMGNMAEQRKRFESELAVLKERYGDDHPEVQRLRRSIQAMEAADAGTSATPRSGNSSSMDERAPSPDNPAYVLLSTQIEGVKRELTRLSLQREDLRAKQRTNDSRMLQVPEVEREYRELTRDYENAQARYREISMKQLQAESALELEMDLKGQRFSLVEAASRPQTPTRPNRPMIALLGLLASVGSGLGLAWLREAADSSVKGPLELARMGAAPILIAIPYIETQGERLGKRRRAAAIAGLIALVVSGILLAAHLFVKPLPSLLDSVLARIRMG